MSLLVEIATRADVPLESVVRVLTREPVNEAHKGRILSVLDSLGPIWPTRDVWTHPLVGRVPFHKLQQWLSYSLCETLELSWAKVSELDELTGLAEYRNGGLFIDGGVLVPQGEALLDRAHEVSSQVVVEWRALTVALLDRTADELRRLLGLSREQLPLARDRLSA